LRINFKLPVILEDFKSSQKFSKSSKRYTNQGDVPRSDASWCVATWNPW